MTYGGPTSDRPEAPLRSSKGRRFVISADSFNRSAIGTVLVAAITTSQRSARMPGNVILPAGTGGLERESVVNVSQLATVDKGQLVTRLGTLGAGFMHQVDSGLSLVLGL